MKQLIDFFKDKEVKHVLDVGTGSGNFIDELKAAFPGAKITGIDPSSESLETARQRFPDADFRAMTAEKLDFPVNTFDAASISMALHHLPNIQQSLAQMQRVVKPGGWLIIAELFSDNLNPAQEVHKLYHHFRSKIDRLNGISHNKTFTKAEILKMVENSGIEIVRHFVVKNENNPANAAENLDDRVQKMETMLETIKHLPEYELLQPKIAEFREKSLKYGFQQASRVVIIGKRG